MLQPSFVRYRTEAGYFDVIRLLVSYRVRVMGLPQAWNDYSQLVKDFGVAFTVALEFSAQAAVFVAE